MRRSERDPVIVAAVRTPVGRGHPTKGHYREIHPADLLGRCIVGLLSRVDIDPVVVENVVIGCVYQIAEQATGIARNAWLQKGLPISTGATTVDIRCGSGQQATHIGAMSIAAGVNDVVITGGVEHMGRVGFSVNQATQEQFGRGFDTELRGRYALVPQGVSAELIADQWDISRAEMDQLALRSHRLANEATQAGTFAHEIVPIEEHTEDQGIRPDTTIDALAALPAVFRTNGRVTAGNSSQVSDGAAALLLTSPDRCRELGLRPRARVVDQVVLGVDPVTMLTGPIAATEMILKRNHLAIDDIDLIEINEAFASVVIAWEREHHADMNRVNIHGGAIALGHPLGSTGARLLTTLLHELEQEDKELGLVTMCCGGGLGTATLIQRI